MSNLGEYYLSSLESYELEEPRKCTLLKIIKMPSGKVIAIAEIFPEIIGQKYGCKEDIKYVVISHRHEGFGLFPIAKFPCFVFVAIPLVNDVLTFDKLETSQLNVIAWGELYRTESDARNHVFDK